MTYISSLSLTSPLRQTIQQLTSQLTESQTEASSGVYADLGLQLGAHTGTSVSLKNETDQLTAYTNSNTFAATRLSTTSTVLDSMTTSAQSVSNSLITAAASSSYSPSLTTGAQSALQSLTGGLNTAAGDQYVFGGLKTDTSPIADYFSTPTSAAKNAVDTSFNNALTADSTTASSMTGAQMTSFLTSSAFTSQFTGSGWANWSSASSTPLTSNISSSQSLTTSVSANQNAFQSLAEGYTMLTEFTGSNMSADARSAVVSQAQTLINTGLAGLNAIQSNVGSAQSTITATNSQASAQIDVLKTSVSSMDSVDTVTLANTIASLQNQLQSSYELTSSLQKLSLTNYLTAG